MKLHRKDFFCKHWKIITLPALSLAGLACVGAIIIMMVSTAEPPSPNSADFKDIGKFINSNNFLDMSSHDREKFVEGVVRRYMQLSSDERTRAKNELRSLELDKKISRRAKKSS